LVQYWAHRLSSFKAGLKVLVISHLGDIPFFFFFFLVWARFQTTSLPDLLALFFVSSFEYVLVGPFLLSLNVLAGLLLSGAVFLKSAQFIFYPWLLDAMEAPVPISAQLHSSTLVVIGFYLFFRFAVLFFLAPSLGSTFIFVGLLTALGASFLGFFQEDGKRLLACSTAGQLGYVITTLGLGFFEEAQLLLVFCCTNKAFTFVWFGTLMQRFSGLSDFRFISFSPLLSVGEHAGLCAALANFTVFPGAYSWHVKGLFIKGYVSHSFWATSVALDFLQLTWLLSSLYMGRLYLGLFLRTLAGALQTRAVAYPLTSPLIFAPSLVSFCVLSLPFLVVALVSFFSLLNLEGLAGFPLVDPQ
jgi:NADH:ubiquinone oxidoreductase subunit 5 (subunit L)/multisubunit Na+/H+ antiporter MnhA subunit